MKSHKPINSNFIRRLLAILVVTAMLLPTLPIIPAAALNGVASYKPAESNIALKYWVTATASSNAENAGLAIDGKSDTAWVADGSSASLTVDLGGTYDAIRKTQTVFSGNNSVYKYRLDGSTDGDTWFLLADRTGNTRVAQGFTDVFSRAGIRYIRLTITEGSPVGVKDFKIFNYLRPNMDNGADIGSIQTGTFYYNASNNPPQMMPDGSRAYRGGAGNEASISTGANFYGLARDMGWHTTRLRIWNFPRSEGTSSKTAALGTMPAGNVNGGSSPNTTRNHARYVKGAGQNLAIDFHYADSWSDPQNQPKPYEWAELPFESADPETNDLIKATYNFTYDMIKSLIDQGTAPTIVALGNEITNGMMWGREYELTNPYCDYHDYYRRYIRDNPNAPLGGGIEWVNYENAEGDKTSPEYLSFLASVLRLAKLVDAGQRAIQKLNAEYDLKILTEMHFAFNVFEGSPKTAHDPEEVFEKNVALVVGLADHLKTMSGMTDRIGISYYPDWHGTYGIVQKNIVELAKLLPPGVLFNIAECSPSASGTVTNWMSDPNKVAGPWNPDLPSSFTRTAQTQGDDTVNILTLINDVPNNVGMGVWPWNGQSVFFTGGQARAGMLAFTQSFATGVVESGVYASTAKDVAPILPATVKELTVATGELADVAVEWDEISSASYANAGVFEVKGTAAAKGNMNEVTAFVTVAEKLYEVPNEISRLDFNEGWQFLLASRTPSDATGGWAANGFADPAGAPTTEQIINPAFDDSGWRTVQLPHDYAIEGYKVSSGSSGSQAYYQGGLGWYRKTFVVPASMADKRIQLDFEGVYKNSVVYVNGKLVGNYPSGYTGFTYDITEYLEYGEDNPNTVVVKVQNKSPSGRWYTGSGISRPVTMIVSGQVRFLRNGVVITTPTLEANYKADKSSYVKVAAKTYSDAENSNLRIVNTVYDAAGAVKFTSSSDWTPSNPSTFTDLVDDFVVPDINLWTLEDPYRYTVVTDLYFRLEGDTGNGTLYDSLTNKIGFRWFRIDSDKGAFLNDKYFKFQGVDLHHDDGALGGAGTYDAMRRKMLILKEMGVNSYRSAHNPPSKAIIDVCSELGIVVMEEVFDGWGATKGGNNMGLFFFLNIPSDWKGSLAAVPPNTTWSEWETKEMVGRDVNEPSVVMWSIGNEVGGVGTRPSWYNWNDFWREGDPTPTGYTATTINHYTEGLRLRNYMKEVDQTRYIVIGEHQYRNPPVSGAWDLVAQMLDGFGLNYNTAASVDRLHQIYPSKFLFESESSSQTGVRGVYFTPQFANTAPNQTPGNRGVSSYDNQFASWTMPNEYGLKKDRDREFFLGQFIWSGFDYLGEPTPFSVYPYGNSNFGCIDLAGFPKDSFYLYRSQWVTDKNTTHIVPMNWNDWYPGESVEVWGYTNAYQAELFLNGESLGVKRFDKKETTFGKDYYETTEPTVDGGGNGYRTGADTNPNNPGGYVSPNGSYGKLHLTWHVPFAPGELKLVSKDELGNIVGEDVLKTAGQAYTVNIKPDKTVVKADGKSLVYFELDVVDEAGVMLPNAKNLLKFNVTGGTIVGVDNGKPDSTELYKWNNVDRSPYSQREAFNGKALCIVEADKNAGEITLTASSDNMVDATIKVLKTADGKGTYESVCIVDSIGTPVSASLVGGDITVAIGKPPVLPVQAEVTYQNGAKLMKKVTWNAIDSGSFAVAGVIQITGTAVGLPVTANVTVTADVTRQDIARNTTAGAQDFVLTETGGPLATASFTAGTNYPNNLLNGNTTNNWSNRGNGGATVVLSAVTIIRPYDWVSVYWNGNRMVSEVDLYFTTGSTGPANVIPSRINVQYWDGFEWIDAPNQSTVFATASNQASQVVFDPVVTTKIRAQMFTSTGSLTMVRFEAFNISEDIVQAEIVSLADVAVTTQAGTAPQLPATVVATFDNDATGEVPVVWDTVDPASYAQAGAFTVEGTVANTDIKAKANVTVTQPPPPDAFGNKSFEDGTTPWMLKDAATGATTPLTNTSENNYYRRNDSQNVHGSGTFAVNYSVTGVFSGHSEMYQDVSVGESPGIYTLSAWVQGVSNGTGILEIFAEADGESYSQTMTTSGWRNWVNPEIKDITITDTARVGIRITYGNGSWYWIDDFDLVKTGDATRYTVTFVDWDGTELKTQSVLPFGAAQAPDDPTRAGYTFIGWDKDFASVTSDLTVTAQYESNKPGALVSGPSALWASDTTATYTVSVRNMPELTSAIKLTVSFEDRFFSAQSFAPMGGWRITEDPTWQRMGDNWQMEVVLAYVGGADAGRYDIYQATLANKGGVDGTAEFKIVGIEAATPGWDFAVEIVGSAVTAVSSWLLYDVNRDGKVTLADVAAAAYFFMAQKADADWAVLVNFENPDIVGGLFVSPERCDVNFDGVVDIEDLILILNNFTQ